LPHTAARLFHLELRQASASHATASNFDKLTEAESAICLVGRLRVKRVILTMRRPRPIYPDKQTFSASVGMSQTCQKRLSDTGVIRIRSNVVVRKMC
jgi:hypothetical protein